MKNGKLQCKDIPDLPILEFLLKLEREEIVSSYASESKDSVDGFVHWNSPWGCVWLGVAHSVQHAMPLAVHDKDTLVRAKMQMLINRGLVSGCTCGCRGDFELTDKGREELGVAPTPKKIAADLGTYAPKSSTPAPIIQMPTLPPAASCVYFIFVGDSISGTW
jgi:hypothetical protein